MMQTPIEWNAKYPSTFCIHSKRLCICSSVRSDATAISLQWWLVSSQCCCGSQIMCFAKSNYTREAKKKKIVHEWKNDKPLRRQRAKIIYYYMNKLKKGTNTRMILEIEYRCCRSHRSRRRRRRGRRRRRCCVGWWSNNNHKNVMHLPCSSKNRLLSLST